MPYTTPQWLRFLELAGRADLAADPGIADAAQRSRRFEELYGVLAEVMPQRTTQEWVALLLEHDILFGEVNKPDDLLQDPHLAAMNMFPRVRHPTEGEIRLIGFPVSYSRTPNTLRHLPPNIGEQTDEILAEAGYSPAEIKALKASGAAASPRHGEAATA
jgi:crotonobetainyl-CoA:carnitine CoA-transferase CaiB-like acyl-CoA transferase